MLGVQKISDSVANRVFSWVHRNNLVYNTCWEDPAIDRVALDLSEKDRLLVISSAGCNALDYLLAGCGEVHAVDMNFIQNALLELKRAAVVTLEYADFDMFFGHGRHDQALTVYQRTLRPMLSQGARAYWDKYIYFFNGTGWRDSFYYRGCSGLLAKFLLTNLFRVKALQKPLEDLVNADSLERQSEIYYAEIKPRLWTRWMEWLISRNLTMNLMGVPRAQKEQMTQQYPGGVPKYIEHSLEDVLTKLRFRDNYFYRVYIEGCYPRDCRPEYVKEGNFDRLKRRICDLHIHTGTVANILEETDLRFSRFVLLDHMDWMSVHKPQELVREWNAILFQATSNARVIYRSAALNVTYLDDLIVNVSGARCPLGAVLTQRRDLANSLHPSDRVHTYASFYIADLPEQ